MRLLFNAAFGAVNLVYAFTPGNHLQGLNGVAAGVCLMGLFDEVIKWLASRS